MRSCGVDWNQTSRLTPSPKVSFLACVRPHAAGQYRALRLPVLSISSRVYADIRQ